MLGRGVGVDLGQVAVWVLSRIHKEDHAESKTSYFQNVNFSGIQRKQLCSLIDVQAYLFL